MKKTLFVMKTIMAASKNKKIIKKKVKAIKKAPAKNRSSLKNKKTSLKKKAIRVVKRKVVSKKVSKKAIKKRGTDLKRFPENPIIEPTVHAWESKATFNPTAIYHSGKIHILYRAIGDSDNSVLGYANTNDGFTISETSPQPAYFPYFGLKYDTSLPSIGYGSGGGWGGGSEDPRMTLLDGNIYVLYTAFDGWGSVRIGLISISLGDFLAKRFNNWKGPVLISPPGEIQKNWVLFPEKINGKFAILHSISPNIMIDYFDSLDEFDGRKFIQSFHSKNSSWGSKNKLVRGVGPAPIKTKYGWLVLYHAVEKNDYGRYKLWAMILDEKDPTKVLYDSNQPILEPDLWYENEGYKGGVVYACGAVVKDGELFVYYGGADKVSCVATVNLDKFLKELIAQKVSRLKGRKIKP